MKLFPFTLISLALFVSSCGNGSGKNAAIDSHRTEIEASAGSAKDLIDVCDRFQAIRFPSDETKKMYLREILAEEKLTENNKEFISALISAPVNVLAPQKPLYPIFKLSGKSPGIFAFPKYDPDSNFEDISAEKRLIGKHQGTINNSDKLDTSDYFIPNAREELIQLTGSADIFYYSFTGRGKSSIENFGMNNEECFDYYTYPLVQNEMIAGELLLFGSPFKIDLAYGNFPEIDSLLKAQHKNECLECPTSYEKEKTFARLAGTDNVYFIYADTFPFNDKMDTPSRGIVFLNGPEEISYLWYEEIDLFGCSCL